MRIESVAIKNLRCIKDGIANLDPYTCLVGPNGAGKSTFLHALNIVFRHVEDASTDVTSLTAEDFYLHDTTKPIEITVTFTDLTKEAEEDFKGYARQGKLIISVVAVFDKKANRAEVKQYGQRLGMTVFKPFFRDHGDGAAVGDLRTAFEKLEQDIPDLAARNSKKTRDAMYQTLRDFEAERPGQCEVIPSEDQFYGVSKGAPRLEKYIQWIFIPAVKHASDEQSETKTGSLGKLLARTVCAKVNFAQTMEALLVKARQQYQKMLDDNEPILKGVSEALQKRLAEWAHPAATLRVAWQQDSSKAVRVDPPLAGVIAGESGYEGSLVRFGHGFQRSYLLALLQELATGDDRSAPTLILGCEEPELYQHPPEERHLAGVFETLAQDNAQIIVTTHSPYFVSGKNFESVRMVRRDLADNCASIRQYSHSKVAERFAEVVGEPPKEKSAALSKVHQALQPALNEMFFTQRLVLVEGLEDIAYIHSWLILTGRWEELELELEEVLRDCCRLDEILPVPKGVRGADILQKVINKSGICCGSIIWEAKHTKSWSDGWISKLKDDQQQARADIAVLVTDVLPKEIECFGRKEGVWITVPRYMPGLVAALRLSLEEVAQPKRAVASKNETVEALFNYLTGPDFANRVEAIMRGFIGMKEELDDEKRVTIRRWAKREKQLDLVLGNTSGMYGDLQGYMGKSLKPIAALEPSDTAETGEQLGLEIAAQTDESV